MHPTKKTNSLVLSLSKTDPRATGSLTIPRSFLGKTVPARCFGLREHVRFQTPRPILAKSHRSRHWQDDSQV